jgi:hypothetical protein
MPRGSKPGERRGGRQRATPNRRTVLTNTILAAAAANPTATVYNLVLILAKDQALAADARMAIARKALLFGPSRSMHNRAAAANGHGKPSSEMGTRIGPDHEANKRTAPKRSGAIAAKAGLATDLLFAVAQDIAAAPADRRKAASQVAEFFLPKTARGKKPRRSKFPPDEYGFVVDPETSNGIARQQIEIGLSEA